MVLIWIKNMNKRQSVAIVFGGQSGEHEVSLMSAKSIYDAIDKEKYNVKLIGIDKTGQWYLGSRATFLLNENDQKLIKLNKENATHIVAKSDDSEVTLHNTDQNTAVEKIDVFFNIIHGSTGEDGAIQGLFEMLGAAYVGAGVLGSAVGMDKEIMKRLLISADIPVGKFTVIKKHQLNSLDLESISHGRHYPFFIKPANAGSSVGVNKVKNFDELIKAINEALQYDNKVLIEEYIIGREIECAVLGNDEPIASVCGEIIPHHEFYSYDAKYIDENGATLKIPADIPPETQKKIQDYAIQTFQTLECRGLARVDFFLTEDNQIYVNEINTLPGFTNSSMYPKLWEGSGISYSKLIDRLINLAIEEKVNKDYLKKAIQHTYNNN